MPPHKFWLHWYTDFQYRHCFLSHVMRFGGGFQAAWKTLLQKLSKTSTQVTKNYEEAFHLPRTYVKLVVLTRNCVNKALSVWYS
jgi:hypothetical protein